MSTIVWVVWIWALLYAAGVFAVLFGLRRMRNGTAVDRPTVSVVVAARNEAGVIGRCLGALRGQDYDPGRFEVIVADDRSTDGTSDVVREFMASWDRLRCIRIDETPEGISPKKNALASAIGLASGEIVLQTDADCEPPSGWVSGMVRGFEPGVGFVAGIAPYRAGGGMLNSFVRHEYLWNAALLSAGITLGRGIHASGRNLGFRRDLYMRIGGYGDSARILSGDDTLLLQRILRSGLARAAVMPDPSTYVLTDAPNGLGALFRQRIRHLSTGRHLNSSTIATGALVYGFHCALVIAFVLSPFSGAARAAAFGGFLIRCAADACAALVIERTLGLGIRWREFLPNELLLTVYWAFMPAAAGFVRLEWKEGVPGGGSS